MTFSDRVLVNTGVAVTKDPVVNLSSGSLQFFMQFYIKIFFLFNRTVVIKGLHSVLVKNEDYV